MTVLAIVIPSWSCWPASLCWSPRPSPGRRDEAIGALSARPSSATAAHADRPAPTAARSPAARSSGPPQLEQRRRTSCRPARPPGAVRAARPEHIGVTRRQFFNRSIVTLMGLGLSGFGAAVLAFLWPQSGGFGSRSTSGPSTTSSGPTSGRTTGSLRARGPHVGHRVPARRCPKAEAVYPPVRARAWRPGVVALYQKCPHLGCRVPECPARSGSSAAATARSTTGSARRRAARPRAAWTASPSRSPAAVARRRHRHRHPGPAIGTNTTGQEAEGPHCIGRSRPPLMLSRSAGHPDRRRRCDRRRHRSGGSLHRSTSAPVPRRGRLGDRAGPEPQALLLRRGARGQEAGAQPLSSACSGHARRRRRPAAVLARRAGPQAGAIADFDKKLRRWGARLFATTADGGFNCAGCHGRGARDILVYGRPFSPMSPWGVEGGGP
jgi:cytochrome b6-f complex iron-sulfur subunit